VNPLDIIKRLDVRQNVTIRVIDEPTGKVVQEHVGHNAATNSLLTGIAHYLMGDGVLNQAKDTLSSWVPQYISLGTMGLTSQASDESGRPIGIGYTPAAPASATPEEQLLNEKLRFEEYINQTPGFGADGYDSNSNNDRDWFGLGYPYSDKPNKIVQDFYDGGATEYILTNMPIQIDTSSIVSVTIYPDGVINQDIHDSSVIRSVLSTNEYSIHLNSNNEAVVYIPNGTPVGSRLAIIYLIDSKDAVNCELITSETLRSKITYRSIIPEVQSEIPNTLDVIYSAFISLGALKQFRGANDYIYITEAGLWSKPYYSNSGDNGLLAGYRILPTDDEASEVGVQQIFTGDGTSYAFTFNETALEITSVTIDNKLVTNYNLDSENNQIVFVNIDGSSTDPYYRPAAGANIIVIYKTTASWKDMSLAQNRLEVQDNIIRVGVNQVAQVIWKLQLGGLEQLNGLRYIYPSQYPDEVWEVWTST
jgi:hypothetical protein